MPAWWPRLRAFVRRGEIDRDLRDELDAHLQMEIEERVERGLSAEAARAAALGAFGSQRSIRESALDAWRIGVAEALVQDLGYAARLLRPVRSRAHRFGGSHAQRDVLDLTLIVAASRAGQNRLAAALLAERAGAARKAPETRKGKKADSLVAAA